jgi:hypothetical protein
VNIDGPVGRGSEKSFRKVLSIGSCNAEIRFDVVFKVVEELWVFGLNRYRLRTWTCVLKQELVKANHEYTLMGHIILSIVVHNNSTLTLSGEITGIPSVSATSPTGLAITSPFRFRRLGG